MLKHNLLPLDKRPWLIFLLPFLVFMLVGTLEPASEGSASSHFSLGIPYAWYPLVYTLKIVLTLAAIVLVMPGYRQFPLRLSPWAIAVGSGGAVIWIVLCTIGLPATKWLADISSLPWLAGLGARAAYNPFEQLGDHAPLAWCFLAVRLLGLACVVPLIEEFFLRGFLMRFVIDAHWWEVPFGKLTALAVAASIVAPALSHPWTELGAVIAWFSLVTWLMAKTKNIWDCVAAHAVTNLLLGIYVLLSGQWWLW